MRPHRKLSDPERVGPEMPFYGVAFRDSCAMIRVPCTWDRNTRRPMMTTSPCVGPDSTRRCVLLSVLDKVDDGGRVGGAPSGPMRTLCRWDLGGWPIFGDIAPEMGERGP